MKLTINIDKGVYDYLKNMIIVEDPETMFKQSKEDRIKTLVLFDAIDAIKTGTIVEGTDKDDKGYTYKGGPVKWIVK